MCTGFGTNIKWPCLFRRNGLKSLTGLLFWTFWILRVLGEQTFSGETEISQFSLKKKIFLCDPERNISLRGLKQCASEYMMTEFAFWGELTLEDIFQ